MTRSTMDFESYVQYSKKMVTFEEEFIIQLFIGDVTRMKLNILYMKLHQDMDIYNKSK